MAHQRKQRLLDERLPYVLPQAHSSLFTTLDVQKADDETIHDRASSSSLTLEDHRQSVNRPGFNVGQISIFPPNRAAPSPIQRRSRGPLIQAKLTVGPVGDKYEREADRVAAAVVDTINRPVEGPTVQREAIAEDEDSLQMQPQAILQRQPDPGDDDESLQMKPQLAIQRQGMVGEEDESLQLKPQGAIPARGDAG